MSKKLWAAEKSFVLDYQSQIENATADQVATAEQTFGGKPLPEILSLDGSTAIINVTGVLTRNGPSPIARYFGFEGTGYNQIIESIKSVINDDSIKKVRLIMDTPGGEVSGVDEVYQAINSLSKKKNVIAENHGLLASAGYWLASTASKIIATSDVAETGSVGVIITVVDYSKMDERFGIREVRIVSKNAPNKAPDVAKKAGRDVLQDRVDAIERVFIQRIATGRKKSASEVIENFGKGGLLIAEDPDEKKNDAISVGMIDKVVGFDINKEPESNDDSNSFADSQGSGNLQAIAGNSSHDSGENNNFGGHKMSLKELLNQNPDANAEYNKALEDQKNAGILEGKKDQKGKMDAHVNKCLVFLNNEKYNSKSFQGLVVSALKGELDFSAVQGAAAVLDVSAEEKASLAVKAEQDGQGETQGQANNQATGDEAKFQDSVALDKKEMGMK